MFSLERISWSAWIASNAEPALMLQLFLIEDVNGEVL